MAERDINTIKSAFENGDVPTQTDFADMIDSSHNSLAHTNQTIADNISKTAAITTAVQTNSASWQAGGTPTSETLQWVVYNTYNDLPSPTDKHGMFAHVHDTGTAYYAHAGSWVQIATGSGSGGSGADLSNVTQSILPSNDISFDLGSETKRWKDLYLSGNTIYLGDQALSYDNTDGLKLGDQKLKDAIGVPSDVKDLADSTNKFFDGDYDKLSNTPTIPTDVKDLADSTNKFFDGDYDKLSNTPTIPVDIKDLADTTNKLFNGNFNSLINQPTIPTDIKQLADTENKLVAATGNFSGNYSDLIGAPTIPTDVKDLADTTNKFTRTVSWSDVAQKPVIPTSINDLTGSVLWSDIGSKPTWLATFSGDVKDLADSTSLLAGGGSQEAEAVKTIISMDSVGDGPFAVGSVRFVKSTNQLKIWNGTAWVDLQSGGGTSTGGGSGGISITTTQQNVGVSNANVTITGEAGIMISFDQTFAVGRVVQTNLYIDGVIVATITYPIEYVGKNLEVQTSAGAWNETFPELNDNLYLKTDGYTTPDTDGDGTNDDTDAYPFDPTNRSGETTGNRVTLTTTVVEQIYSMAGVTVIGAVQNAEVQFNELVITDGTVNTTVVEIDGNVIMGIDFVAEHQGKFLQISYAGNSWATTFPSTGDISLSTSNANQPPQIALVNPQLTTLSYLGTWIDPGATVTDDDLANNAYTTSYGENGAPDPNTPGVYQVIYTTDQDSVGQTNSVTRTVTVTNQTPSITLVGSATINLDYKSSGSYNDAGITISDELVTASRSDELTETTTITYTDLQDNESTVGFVNKDNPGEYLYTYTVSDGVNNPVTATRTVNVVNKKPVITLIGANPLPLLTGVSYVEPGFTVTDETKTTADVVVTGTVDHNIDGDYTISYNLTDEHQNNATQVTRTVRVGNQTPVVTLKGDADLTIDYKGAAYNEPGVNVNDETLTPNDVSTTIQYEPQFGDPTPQPATSVNINNSGVYTLTYTVGPDEAGQSGSVSRTVRVINDEPVITLINNTNTHNNPAYKSNSGTYNDPGVNVVDETAGVGSVVKTYTLNGSPIDGPVDTNTAGEYQIIYTVTDDQSQTASVTRAVTVTNLAPVVTLVSPGTNSVAYLGTWNDPGATVVDETVTADDIVKTYTFNANTASSINTSIPGEYTVTYTVTDDASQVGSATRTVTVTNQAPVIQLQGATTTTIAYQGTYTEPDPAYAVTSDENVSTVQVARTVTRDNSAIADDATVDPNTPGVYKITYTATDDQGATDSVTRTVTVSQNLAPVITLKSGVAASTTVENGGTYTEPSDPYTVTDENVGTTTVTRSVTRTVSNSTTVLGDVDVDTSTAGTYSIIFTAEDSDGLTDDVTITVIVEEANTNPVNQNVAVGETATLQSNGSGNEDTPAEFSANSVTLLDYGYAMEVSFTAKSVSSIVESSIYVLNSSYDLLGIISSYDSYDGTTVTVKYNGVTKTGAFDSSAAEVLVIF